MLSAGISTNYKGTDLITFNEDIVSNARRSNAIGEEYLDTNIEDIPYDEDEIVFTLYAQTEQEILNFDTNNSGMTLVSFLEFNDNCESVMKYSVSSEKATSTVNVLLANENVLSITIYSYKTDLSISNTRNLILLAINTYCIHLIINIANPMEMSLLVRLILMG